MTNCKGHKCNDLRPLLYYPSKSKTPRKLPMVLICAECVESECPCLGIHTATGTIPQASADVRGPTPERKPSAPVRER